MFFACHRLETARASMSPISLATALLLSQVVPCAVHRLTGADSPRMRRCTAHLAIDGGCNVPDCSAVRRA